MEGKEHVPQDSPNQEGVTKKIAIELAQCGIERGNNIGIEQVEQLIRKNPWMIEGIKRNFYRALREAIVRDFEVRTPNIIPNASRELTLGVTDGGTYAIAPFTEKRTRRVKRDDVSSSKYENMEPTRREVFVKDEREKATAEFLFRISPKGEVYGVQDRGIILSFIFSVKKDIARKYWNDTWEHFTSLDDFTFEGTAVYMGSIYYDEGKMTLREAAERRQADTKELKIDYGKLLQMLEMLKPEPDADCSEAIATLEQITKDEKINPEDIEELKQAIREYATFEKPKPKSGFEEIGRCQVVPNDFNAFCKNKFGLKLNTDSYHGGPAWGYHEISTFDKGVCIDWTAQQFANSIGHTSYPYIYHKNNTKHQGRLWSSIPEEEQNEIMKYKRKNELGIEY